MSPFKSSFHSTSHPCLLFISALALLFCILSGCSSSRALSVKYKPLGRPSFVFPLEQKVVLSLGPVKGDDSQVWYRSKRHTWLLDTVPSTLIYSAISSELKRMGITIKNNTDRALGRIEIENRWFGPYGNTPFSAAVILSLAFYPRGASSPSWRCRLEGGAFGRESVLTDEDRDIVMERVASEALTNAVRKLGWDQGFIRVIQDLSLKDSPA